MIVEDWHVQQHMCHYHTVVTQEHGCEHNEVVRLHAYYACLAVHRRINIDTTATCMHMQCKLMQSSWHQCADHSTYLCTSCHCRSGTAVLIQCMEEL